jgi:hypothetical protein
MIRIALILALAATTAHAAAWERHTITAGATTGTRRGADGVDIVGVDIATAWEEGGIVTVAHRPSDPLQPWPTTTAASGVVGVEDAKLGDLDGDGALDVAIASDAGALVYLAFGGGAVAVPASMTHGRVMQVAIADMDADGDLDVIFGSRAGAPAVIAWLANPGAVLARTGPAWVYHPISAAGWAMSIVPLDVDGDGDTDVVVSDRASYRDATGVTRWDLYGARWEERTAAGWSNHAISTPAGSCTTCTPGDEMFLRVVDWDGDGQLDVVDGTSTATKPNRIAIRRNLGGWMSWSQELVPAVAGVGHYAGVDVADIDRDGRQDLVVSTWEVNALPTSPLIGVYWLRSVAAGTWELHDISGPDGSKFDNPLLIDVDGDGWIDVIDSEQIDQLGVVWYRNPGATA